MSETVNVPSPDPARVARYAEAIVGADPDNPGRPENWHVEAIAVIALADAEMAEVRAEVEQLRRGGRELGRMVVRHGEMVLQATGLHDWIDEDGDGDWAAVWENLAELRPRAEAAEAEVERLRAASVESSNTYAQWRDDCAARADAAEAESASRGDQIVVLGDVLAMWRERALVAEARVAKVERLAANARRHSGGSHTAQVDVLSIERALDLSVERALTEGGAE